MAKKLKVVDVVKEPKIDIVALIRELSTIKLQKSELEKREKSIKDKIDNYVDKNVTADSFGNRFYKTEDDFGTPLVLKREIRKSMSINLEKLKATFPKKLLRDIITTETIEVINEDVIEQMLASEEITLEDVEAVTDTKVSYATKFIKQDEAEEE